MTKVTQKDRDKKMPHSQERAFNHNYNYYFQHSLEYIGAFIELVTLPGDLLAHLNPLRCPPKID